MKCRLYCHDVFQEYTGQEQGTRNFPFLSSPVHPVPFWITQNRDDFLQDLAGGAANFLFASRNQDVSFQAIASRNRYDFLQGPAGGIANFLFASRNQDVSFQAIASRN